MDSPAQPKPKFQLFRRDFLVGATAGLIVGKGSEYVQPLEWTLKGMPLGTKLSFAQNGEDLVAASLFEALGVQKPSYLDIGAYDPILGNNTYLFYRQGGRGVLVEPNVDMTDRLKGKRPGDVVLTAGIGFTPDTEADYYRLSMFQLNTFDKDRAEQVVRDSGGKVQLLGVVKMPLLNVNGVIADHFGGKSPDYLSIDAEGLDLAILKTFDFAKYRPKLICAETLVAEKLVMNTETAPFLETHGYVARCMTYPNTLFVDRKLLG